MAPGSEGSATVPSLPPPLPKSPPLYPDLYGKRRELARVQMLEREISFLEDELKSAEGLQPASRCCKEIDGFLVANSDPLIPTSRKIHRSCRFWKWLCKASCFSMSWICCCGCSTSLELPNCCLCNICDCHPGVSCSTPKCQCCQWPRSKCFNKFCSRICCSFRCPCSGCSCSEWTCCCRPRCPECSCIRNCCHSCCFCY